MNGVQTELNCKPNVKRCKRFVFPEYSPLLYHNTLKTKAIKLFQADHILTRFVFPPLTEYITFSQHATKEFIRLAPKGTPVYYLTGDLTPKELKAWGCAGPDYHFSVFQKHPEWIKECHDLGMKVNAWTVNEAKDMEWLISQGVDFITTNEPVVLEEILKKK